MQNNITDNILLSFVQGYVVSSVTYVDDVLSVILSNKGRIRIISPHKVMNFQGMMFVGAYHKLRKIKETDSFNVSVLNNFILFAEDTYKKMDSNIKLKNLIINNRYARMNDIEKFMFRSIYDLLSDLTSEYPDFYNWYHKTVESGLGKDRKIFCSIDDGKIIGMLILKYGEDAKISTIRVLPEYHRRGVGSQLLLTAIKELNNLTPKISVSSKRSIEFARLFTKFNFKYSHTKFNRYIEGIDEHFFN